MKVEGKGITPLVKRLRVRARDDAEAQFGSLEIYDIKDIAGQEFDVIAIGMHVYDGNSTVPVAWLDTPKGIREVALSKLIVAEAEY